MYEVFLLGETAVKKKKEKKIYKSSTRATFCEARFTLICDSGKKLGTLCLANMTVTIIQVTHNKSTSSPEEDVCSKQSKRRDPHQMTTG